MTLMARQPPESAPGGVSGSGNVGSGRSPLLSTADACGRVSDKALQLRQAGAGARAGTSGIAFGGLALRPVSAVLFAWALAPAVFHGGVSHAEAAHYSEGVGLTAHHHDRNCPLLEPESCRSPGKAKFLELWAQKLKCWLCTDVTADLSKLSISIIKEVIEIEIGVTHNNGMQITGEWLDLCLPVYLLAMVTTTRGVPLQPWAMYQFGLNMLWSCRYDEIEFFRLFGVTPSQLAYVFGLVGQPYDSTPQILDMQEPERIAAAGPPPVLPKDSKAPDRPWVLPLIVDVGMGLGADARFYLRQGFRVVAVEANPSALNAALSDPGTKPYVLSGQLMALNAAIAGPNVDGDAASSASKASFWVIDHRPEQSKASAWIAQDGGVEVSVRTTCCADLLRVFGQAVYMKVDVEVNTIDCLTSLSFEAANAKRPGSGVPRDWRPPKYLSLEVEATHLVDPFYEHLSALGYTHYKVCRQFIYSPGPCEQGSYGSELLGCGSGPFGEAAADYLVGARWRPLEELLNDTQFLREFESGFDWFDIHARLPD